MRQIRNARPYAEPHRNLDEGFTLIEVVVALGLLAMMMTSMAALFYSALKVATSNNLRTKATAVATRELESFRVGRYDQVGFYSGQAGYVASFEGRPTVTLGSTAPAGALYAPTGTVTVGNTALTVQRQLVWADAPVPSAPNLSEAYKKSVVIVTWQDQGITRTVRQDSIIYPGGRGPYSGPGSGATTTTTTAPPGTPGPPTLNTATVPAAPQGQSQVDLTWSPTTGPIDHFAIEWSTSPAYVPSSFSPNQPASSTSYSVAGLAPDTTYYFRVYAYGNPSGSVRSAASNALSARTLAPPAPTCTVGAINMTTTASPPSSTKIYLLNNGKLGVDINAVLNLSGTCSGVFELRQTLPSGVAGGTWLLGGSGSTRSALMDVNNDKWDVGLHRFTAYKDGAATASTQSLLVCADTNSPSSNPNQC